MTAPGRLLVRRPSPRLAEGELTHLTRFPVDPDLARRQWEGYVAAFADRGWAVTEVEPADEHPDGVFVEDTVVVFPDPADADLAVLTHPGAPSRRGEVASVARALGGLGAADGPAPRVAGIAPPGTLDGGDVLKLGRTAYVGRGSRTNAEGVAQLAALVEPRGWTVVPVPVTGALHLKSVVTALPDGTVIHRGDGTEALAQPAPAGPGGPAPAETGAASGLDSPALPPGLVVLERGQETGAASGLDSPALPPGLVVPETHGTAVVDLGGGAVVMSADAPRTTALLRARGLDVVPVPITEFEKLEGCVTCLSVRLRRGDVRSAAPARAPATP